MFRIEPPRACRTQKEFVIRCDERGRWVVAEAHGLAGGLFRSRKAAVSFALSEADDDAGRVHVEPAPGGGMLH